MFSHLFFDPTNDLYGFRVARFACPLMRLFALMFIGDDYTRDAEPSWCFRMIDEIVEAMGLQNVNLASEVQRACLAKLLEPMYEPFFQYLTTELGGYASTSPRHGRHASTAHWYVLHRFLCERGEAVDTASAAATVGDVSVEVSGMPDFLSEPIHVFSEKVLLFIELHRGAMDNDRFGEYFAQGNSVFFDKYSSVSMANKKGTLYMPTNPVYAGKFKQIVRVRRNAN